MEFTIDPQGIWYHGSNKVFEVLEEGSTITQWKELAEAFSHKPSILAIDDDYSIFPLWILYAGLNFLWLWHSFSGMPTLRRLLL
ncbi:MAG TPA: hypothetical protein PLG72_05825 [Clostridiales bacterium]|nr:hypothetical protein [Clostridiales bacterium]